MNDPHELLRRSRARALHREGIAMILGVFDARGVADPIALPGRPVPAVEDAVIGDAGALADGFDGIATALHPGGDPGTEAALVDVLCVLAEDRLKAPDAAGGTA